MLKSKIKSTDFTLETLGYIFDATGIDFTKSVLTAEEITEQSGILTQQYIAINGQEVAIEEESTDREAREAAIRLQLKRDFTYQQLGDFLSVPATLIKELVETEIDTLIAAEGADFDRLFATLINKLHIAVATINGFSLEENEVDYFLSHPLDFSRLDFNNMQVESWWRLYDYVTLKEQLPTTEFSLIDIFNYDSAAAPIAEYFRTAIHLVTQWSTSDIEFLLGDYNPLVDFKNEIVLNQMANAVSVARQMGITVKTLYYLGNTAILADEEGNFDAHWEKAQIIKNVAKAKYNESTWTTVATKLNDTLRELQRDALGAHLLNTELIKDHPMGITDADGLYEFFLIDVQMSACMDTSRIVQASAAIQQFVNRVHLNLEEGISPDSLDRNRWEWMKYYRVWEAQMRVLYENYTLLKPEWRQDASPFFDELVSHLTQNDISERTAEEAMRGYLKSMSEVANLNVAGSYQENYKDKDGNLKFKCLHVFGHTNHTPYTYYYRTWNEFGKWSAWEKVDAAIQPVVNTEDGGKPGVHLIPVVWKNRLLLFWPEFMEQTEPKIPTGNFEALSKDNVAAQEPKKYWEVRLAWSEYYDKKWTAKQLSESFIKPYDYFNKSNKKPHEISFSSRIRESNELIIFMEEIPGQAAEDLERDSYFIFSPLFQIKDISYEVFTSSSYSEYYNELFTKKYNNKYLNGRYNYNFQKTSKIHQSLSFDSLYLTEPVEHQLIFPNQLKFDDNPLLYPFFYSAEGKTYFVKSKIVSQDHSLYHFGVRIGRELVIYNAGLDFHTFHHPFVSDFISNLNKNGIGTHDSEKPGLMESDTLPKTENDKLYDDAGVTFVETFDPRLHYVFQPPNLTDPQKTFYKEIIDFDPLGANSKYNWELFFHAPLHIATELSKNGKFKEAIQWFHYIFDPTTDEVAAEGFDAVSRFWKVKPFKTTPVDDFEEFINGLLVSGGLEDSVIKEWRENPFNPHLVASNFPDNYMKYTVLMYVQTLVDWGDSLYRKFTREDVYEAIQLYVIASHILGPKPPFVPKRGTIKKETFDTIRERLTDLNVRVELENSLVYSSADSSGETWADSSSSLLGSGLSYYFCIPPNEKLLRYWETVQDRLFKIRNCKDINGVTRRLALFAPRIDPEALIKAKSAGMDLSDILANLNTPAPHYRFSYLLQKANEFCNDVKGLGAALLSAIEKQDGEALSRLRSTHEIEMLQMMQKIKERQIIDAEMMIKQLLKQRETAIYRFAYYNETLLGNEAVEIPELNELEPDLTDISQIIINPPIPERETDVNVGLVDSNEEGVKIISKEKEDIKKRKAAMILSHIAGSAQMAGSIAALFPTVDAKSQPFGVGVDAGFGGQNVAFGLQLLSQATQTTSSSLNQMAGLASTTASYIRREQEWTHQANLVAKEIGQIELQILSAGIRLQIAEKELENHKKQIDNANSIEAYLKEKFTNKELYMWMKDQLKSLHKQSYDLAFNMAKMAEKAFEFEKGPLGEDSEFINYDYWDNSKYGLLAGEKLQLAIRQLDNAYNEVNTRQFELTKHISLKQLNPIELICLRETGKCGFALVEELFDLDYPGHYNRRIKSVSLSIPCVVGPYTTIPCTLEQSSSSVRVEPSFAEGALEERTAPVPVIATSTGQNDSGVFELNFRDERYIPFEGAGVISEWSLELFNEDGGDFGKSLRQFDYATISDIIIHIRYTAEEDQTPAFRQEAIDNVKSYFENDDASPSLKIFDLKHDFSSQWHRFLNPNNPEDGNVLGLNLTSSNFPYRDQMHELKVNSIIVLARSTNAEISEYAMELTTTPSSDPISERLTTAASEYGELKYAEMDTSGNAIKIDFSDELNWRLSLEKAGEENLTENEIDDLYLILGYEWV